MFLINTPFAFYGALFWAWFLRYTILKFYTYFSYIVFVCLYFFYFTFVLSKRVREKGSASLPVSQKTNLIHIRNVGNISLLIDNCKLMCVWNLYISKINILFLKYISNFILSFANLKTHLHINSTNFLPLIEFLL